MKYEKLGFRYPSDWVLQDDTDGGGANLSDAVILTASGGFQFRITTGGFGHPSSDVAFKVLRAEPITLAGQAAYLDYCANGDDQNDGLAYRLSVSKSDSNFLDTLPSRTPGENGGGAGNMTIELGYTTDKTSGVYTGKPLSVMASDPNVSAAKKLIASMRY